MSKTKMTNEAIEQTVKLIRDELIRQSDEGNLTTSRPLEFPELWLEKSDLIKEHLFEVGDLVEHNNGCICEVIEHASGCNVLVNHITGPITGSLEYYHWTELKSTGHKVIPKEPEIKVGSYVRFKEPHNCYIITDGASILRYNAQVTNFLDDGRVKVHIRVDKPGQITTSVRVNVDIKAIELV